MWKIPSGSASSSSSSFPLSHQHLSLWAFFHASFPIQSNCRTMTGWIYDFLLSIVIVTRYPLSIIHGLLLLPIEAALHNHLPIHLVETHQTSTALSRPNIAQFQSLKIPTSTFLNNVKRVNRWTFEATKLWNVQSVCPARHASKQEVKSNNCALIIKTQTDN